MQQKDRYSITTASRLRNQRAAHEEEAAHEEQSLLAGDGVVCCPLQLALCAGGSAHAVSRVW
jgi:hypothetical protein